MNWIYFLFLEKKGKPKRSRPVPKAADLKKDEDEIRKEKRKSDAAKAPQIEIKEAAKSKFLFPSIPFDKPLTFKSNHDTDYRFYFCNIPYLQVFLSCFKLTVFDFPSPFSLINNYSVWTINNKIFKSQKLRCTFFEEI